MDAQAGKPALLELNRVTVMRGDRAALQDVSLRIEAGGLVSVNNAGGKFNITPVNPRPVQ